MNEKLVKALGCIDNTYICEAARKRRKKKVFLSAVAAILALVLLTNLPTVPFVITARAVATAEGSHIPDRDEDWDTYYAMTMESEESARTAMEDMRQFYQQTSAKFLAEEAKNQIWSPSNGALALSVLAETAAGSTRQELLDLLGVEDMETLREYMNAIWERSNKTHKKDFSELANSLWLDRDMEYDREVMDILAKDYHASVYQGDLGSGSANRAIQNWVNNNTGGLLRQMSKGIDVSAQAPAVDTVLALASTVYLQSKWSEEFSAARNTDGVFHGAASDSTVTYMNKREAEMNYYWGESYGAVSLWMENNLKMWFFLPDEDKTVADVLASEEYLDTMQPGEDEEPQNKWMKVNLSVPKFDVTSAMDLKEGLRALGLTEVFDLNGGDFGDSFETDLPIFVSRVNQASRITIDEQGVTAVSYIELDWGAGAAEPPDEIIDFVLDRPFVFAISTTEGIPLFVGTINQL